MKLELRRLALAASASLPLCAQSYPAGFHEEQVVSSATRISEFHVDHHGTVYYSKKSGQLHSVDQSGGQSLTPLIDISEEIADFADHGLQSFVLDPDFDDNGYVYLYYIVDYHHLVHFGTPSYDPLTNDYPHDSIGRVARYTIPDPHDPLSIADPASRLVLLGQTASDGIPICSSSHGLGSIRFGSDGNLLLSAGDSWLLGSMTSDSCLEDGIISPKEDVIFYTAQLPDSHNGKLLRIDPLTGEGVENNPFFDALAPSAPRSRVYALGLRNPYGFEERPNSAGQSGASALPGSIFIGDVGPLNWEELNVCTGPGQNFGWPAYLAMDEDDHYSGVYRENLDAPNPLFGQVIPGLGLCNQPYFYFQDLIGQDSLNPISWPNPCDPAVEVPSAIPTFMHRRPTLAWEHHDQAPAGSAYVPSYGPGGDATSVLLGDPASPVAGDAFTGNCSVGGHFFQGEGFPASYDGKFFAGDYGERWIRTLEFDANDILLQVEEFAADMGAVIALRSAHGVEGLYFLDYLTGGSSSTIKRVRYSGNVPPNAVLAADQVYGPAPLRVSFSAADSSDPEGDPLEIAWDFGDGSPASPVQAFTDAWHVYPSEDISALGTVVSSLDELTPPTPMGTGAQDPLVIVDLIYPFEGANVPQVQFDTAHVDSSGAPDKGNLDWTGLVFGEARQLLGATWQQGQVFPGLGGWLGEVRLQARNPETQQWQLVQNVQLSPQYVAPGVSFRTHQIQFDPILADGLRVIGTPGGAWRFMSTGELRVLASPQGQAGPKSFSASLSVTDSLGGTDVSSQHISPGNTPPIVEISSPAQGQTYVVGQAFPLTLSALVSDAEHSAAELSCVWDISLVHDNHEHPEPALSGCDASISITPHSELMGDPIHWRISLRVTDAHGLESVATHYMLPAGDCDLSGVDDALEIAQGLLLDSNFNGVPDGCEVDCDADGLNDAFELAAGLESDDNLSGRIDSCEPVLTGPLPGLVNQSNKLVLRYATPSSICVLLFGPQAGALALPGCGAIGDQVSAGILDWNVLAVALTDASGALAQPLFLPGEIYGLEVLFQSLTAGSCEVSSLTSFEFPLPF